MNQHRQKNMKEDQVLTPTSQFPGHLIRRLHQVSTHVFQQKMRNAGFDLTPVQFAALDVLRNSPGIDQASLAHAVAKDRATIGAVADRLAQKGLVTRNVSNRDKRARELKLTEKGEALVAAALPLVEELQKEILPGLNRTEYRQFVELAGKAARAADTVGEE